MIKHVGHFAFVGTGMSNDCLVFSNSEQSYLLMKLDAHTYTLRISKKIDLHSNEYIHTL